MTLTMKCVVAWSDRRNLCSLIGDELTAATGGELRRLGDDANVIWTDISAAEIRDRLRPLLDEDEGLLVAEFETWSGHGNALDAEWLLAHGH
jgi:hypothetical protein